MKNNEKKLYVAYGSNLNVSQMSYRCPDAKIYGSGVLKNYRLSFYGVASIEKKSNGNCPVGLWTISPEDEKNLDRYEGYPRLYRKENIEVTLNTGETVTAMVYIMNRSGEESLPSPGYYETIFDGYNDFGLDTDYLVETVENIYNPVFGKYAFTGLV